MTEKLREWVSVPREYGVVMGCSCGGYRKTISWHSDDCPEYQEWWKRKKARFAARGQLTAFTDDEELQFVKGENYDKKV